jgi:hypothetical protein
MERTRSKAQRSTFELLELASPVHESKITGTYDSKTQTWSNREYSNAGTKKHNEAM